jgi:large subunit ribosomal protein L17
LFDKERITTTLAKAKELRPFAEKLVTMSKKETLHARRQVMKHIHDRNVVTKLFDTLSARYAQRPGGYTRIIKLGPRRGDSAELAIIELVEADLPGAAAEPATEGKKKPTRKKKAAKKKAAAKKKEESEKEPKKKKAAARKKVAKKKVAKKKAAAKTAKKKTARRSKKKAGE